MVSIKSMGAYVPKFRIKKEEFERVWGRFSARGVCEKGVCAADEDPVTMAIESSINAMNEIDLSGDELDSFLLASVNLPYEERSLAPVISSVLGLSPSTFTSSFTSSTRAGTEALKTGIELIKSGENTNVAVSATEYPKANPDNDLDHGLGAGSASIILSNEGPIEIEGATSYQREYMTSRFRRESEKEIEKIGVTGLERQGFVEVTRNSTEMLLDELGLDTSDIDVFAVQQPNCRRPYRTSGSLGIPSEKVDKAIVANFFGDVGCTSPFLSFFEGIKSVEQGDRVVMVSFGSGDVSDAISFKVRENINIDPIKPYRADDYKKFIDYSDYLKLRGDILEEV